LTKEKRGQNLKTRGLGSSMWELPWSRKVIVGGKGVPIHHEPFLLKSVMAEKAGAGRSIAVIEGGGPLGRGMSSSYEKHVPRDTKRPAGRGPIQTCLLRERGGPERALAGSFGLGFQSKSRNGKRGAVKRWGGGNRAQRLHCNEDPHL